MREYYNVPSSQRKAQHLYPERVQFLACYSCLLAYSNVVVVQPCWDMFQICVCCQGLQFILPTTLGYLHSEYTVSCTVVPKYASGGCARCTFSQCAGLSDLSNGWCFYKPFGIYIILLSTHSAEQCPP